MGAPRKHVISFEDEEYRECVGLGLTSMPSGVHTQVWKVYGPELRSVSSLYSYAHAVMLVSATLVLKPWKFAKASRR